MSRPIAIFLLFALAWPATAQGPPIQGPPPTGTHALRGMNQTSVLGRYLPNFRRIVGQMQHDLFHVYTVDQHILMVVRNVRRFTMPEHAHEYPFCSQLMANFERPWVLYVAALFHDVFLTFGMIALFKKYIEFDLRAVAAILTIIGYSMNDTVVVFDRFRENLRKYKRMPVSEVIDMSINEMLTRTIITSFTAIIALVALAFFGGPNLWGLSVIMLFGILIGTYSSIYIAAPVILLWGVKRGGGEETETVKKPAKVGP